MQRKNITRNGYVVILHDDDTTLFADRILCLACKFDYENIYYDQMHVQIIYHRIKNNAYSNICLKKRIFFRNTFHEKLIHFKLHGMCTT